MFRIGDDLAHLQIILVARGLDLHMSRERLQGIVDHQLIHAELQRNHEHQQGVGKHHRADRQPRSSRVTPKIPPRETQGNVH